MEGLYALKSRGNQLLSTRALLQLNEPEPVEPEETLADRMRSRGGISTFTTRLGAARKISDVFPLDTCPADHVHIYVALPDHGEWTSLFPHMRSADVLYHLSLCCQYPCPSALQSHLQSCHRRESRVPPSVTHSSIAWTRRNTNATCAKPVQRQ